ncbi:MAG: bifunctional phosphoribosylaminoimidazolecarboxamide formyltransferase/IMP cyclohydrolase [Caldilinea sp.]|nr:bifunctional phosphoribosylaminoimidazolecarboxamide formyltransferase/IMP cyclohydrolase [Caldilinea sp.]MDW8439785.1 bifunctional phosphoribosylaminoimidazolecarboxamide formyltransferase/IMP cyclohydrolase [Caldilineaceae bacterium]
MTSFRALLSVSDKSGLEAFAKKLAAAGGELIASGGTARRLMEAGVPVLQVEDVTGFPEILGGRVKTLHPAIHGGILARRTTQHLEELALYNIRPIDLVVVNLYPFQKTVAQPNISLATAIEEIDIGGVALLRAAAKNHESVTVVCDPADYDAVAEAIASGGVSSRLRRKLAVKAFRHTAAYDAAIAAYLADQIGEEQPRAATEPAALPAELHLDLTLIQRNRYGENPHQQGGLYGYKGDAPVFEVLHGKEMSYNNWLDLDAAWMAAQDFSDPTAAIIKHGNPCGLASAETLEEAYVKALASDPVSAFGGILAVNRTLDAATAQRAAELFLEVVAAPAYEPEALAILQKKKNVRLLLHTGAATRPLSLRSIVGGVLVQEIDRSEEDMNPANWRVVTQRQPTPAQLTDLAFAWRVARHVKSNAIVYARDRATVGIGAGQMSRIDSVMMAGHKAGDRSRGAVMASDAFFPFPDGIEAAAKHGVTAVVQPGGSVRDEEVIATADRLGLVMCFTGVRHFRH